MRRGEDAEVVSRHASQAAVAVTRSKLCRSRANERTSVSFRYAVVTWTIWLVVMLEAA